MVSTPPAVPSTPPAVDPDRRRKKRRFVLLLAIGVPVLLVIVFAVVAVTTDVIFTNELLSVDFDQPTKKFSTESTADYVNEVVDGVYRMKSNNEKGLGMAMSAAYFERKAFNVDMSATVESVGAKSHFGVGCLSGDLDRIDGGYLMVAGNDGTVSLIRTGYSPQDEEIVAPKLATVPTSNVELQLSCAQTSYTGSSVELTGFINREEVFRVTDPEGFVGFTAGALVFEAGEAGEEVRFDRVHASVPEGNSES